MEAASIQSLPQVVKKATCREMKSCQAQSAPGPVSKTTAASIEEEGLLFMVAVTPQPRWPLLPG